jgi:nucleotide-binding universal stress UspA family protein
VCHPAASFTFRWSGWTARPRAAGGGLLSAATVVIQYTRVRTSRFVEAGRLIMQYAAKEHPEVSVVRQVLAGAPRAALLTASAGAQLLVVGARGRGGLEQMNLGSIAQAMLQYAPCPVGVVRQAG